ncbi:hypothetical protein [Lonsdalea quercina]|uniref:hypothetical protein n=1 Tax=Lonsdalea quercina TaxID=71657 RepID=UPI003974DB6B
MASHPIDVLLIGNNFGTVEMRELESERQCLVKQIEVDVAMARVGGELDMAPPQVAAENAERSDARLLKIADVIRHAEHVGLLAA